MVVVQRADRYLMIQRGPDVIVPGAWCFVGGAIEPGESQEQAIVREFLEEVGGRVRPICRVWEYVRPDGHLRLFWWRADLLDGDELRPNPAEVAEIRWCTPAEIHRLPNVLESNREFLRTLGHDAP